MLAASCFLRAVGTGRQFPPAFHLRSCCHAARFHRMPKLTLGANLLSFLNPATLQLSHIIIIPLHTFGTSQASADILTANTQPSAGFPSISRLPTCIQPYAPSNLD